jgi:endonuclease G, mitochondrial
VIVTNRHVATIFATRRGEGFTFRMGAAGEIRASIDFLEEVENPDTALFRLVRPLHIEETSGLDAAFFWSSVPAARSRLPGRST